MTQESSKSSSRVLIFECVAASEPVATGIGRGTGGHGLDLVAGQLVLEGSLIELGTAADQQHARHASPGGIYPTEERGDLALGIVGRDFPIGLDVDHFEAQIDAAGLQPFLDLVELQTGSAMLLADPLADLAQHVGDAAVKAATELEFV